MPLFRNYYRCPDCGNEWTDDYDAQPDDDCVRCGMRHISPYESEDLEDDEEDESEAEATPDPELTAGLNLTPRWRPEDTVTELFNNPQQPDDAFWKMTRARLSVVPDPMGYGRMRTNTSPDYVATDNFRAFVAYGLQACWLDPSTFSYWHLVREPDIQWHRECFLTILEKVVEGVWDERFEPGEETFDFGSNGDELDIMPANYDAVRANPANDHVEIEPVITIAWRGCNYEKEDLTDTFGQLLPSEEQDPAISLQCCYTVYSADGWEDDEPIYFRRSAIEDRDLVRTIIAEARRINNWQGWGAEKPQPDPEPIRKERIIQLDDDRP